MDSQSLGKIILFFGLFVVLLGLCVLVGGRISFLGRLPGDIHIQKPGFSLHVPVATCLLLSMMFSLILNILFKR